MCPKPNNLFGNARKMNHALYIGHFQVKKRNFNVTHINGSSLMLTNSIQYNNPTT